VSSRSRILEAIRANKPALSPLPELPVGGAGTQVPAEREFRRALAASKTEFVDPTDLPHHLTTYGATTVVSTDERYPGTLDLATVTDPLQLAGADLAILRARLGVAENGAMWLGEDEMIFRVLPFITQHLVLLLDRKELVDSMHDAYRRLDIARTGFGLFVAGPSKTADIEQSLVIGAHGPRSLTVCLEGAAANNL
jgi:L-lactate dehydrogenase complex protein LldG